MIGLYCFIDSSVKSGQILVNKLSQEDLLKLARPTLL